MNGKRMAIIAAGLALLRATALGQTYEPLPGRIVWHDDFADLEGWTIDSVQQPRISPADDAVGLGDLNQVAGQWRLHAGAANLVEYEVRWRLKLEETGAIHLLPGIYLLGSESVWPPPRLFLLGHSNRTEDSLGVATLRLDDGLWHDLVFRRYGGRARIYVDGELKLDAEDKLAAQGGRVDISFYRTRGIVDRVDVVDLRTPEVMVGRLDQLEARLADVLGKPEVLARCNELRASLAAGQGDWTAWLERLADLSRAADDLAVAAEAVRIAATWGDADSLEQAAVWQAEELAKAAQASAIGEAMEAELPVRLLALQRRHHALRLRRAFGGDPLPPAGITISHSLRKIVGHLPCDLPCAAAVAASAARGEAESVQVVVVPLHDANVSMTLEPLRGPDGAELPVERMDVFVVGETWLERGRLWRPDGRPQDRTGLWPDPLVPGNSGQTAADHARVFWLDLRVPLDQPAGDYHGQITVQVDEWRGTIPVELTVHPFAIPERNSLKLDFWYSDDQILRWWGRRPTFEEFERQLQTLARYRLAVAWVPNVNWCPVDIWLEADGSFTFDYGNIDRYLDLAFRHGLNAFNLNHTCRTLGIMAALSPDQCNVNNRLTGQRTNGRYGPDTLTQQQCDALFPVLLRHYVEHLAERGWLRHAHFQSMDEPGPQQVADFQKNYQHVKEIEPRLRRLAANVGFPSRGFYHYQSELYDHVDIVVPLTSHFESEFAAQAKADGKQSWWYVCYSPPPPAANFFITGEPVSHRALFWQMWKYQVEGLLYWGVNQWVSTLEAPVPDHSPRWPDGPFKPQLAGDGMLVYPGRDIGEWWPSIRLAILRDGLEDYEYLRLLKERLEVAEAAGTPQAELAEARALLEIPVDMVLSPTLFNPDPAPWLTWRRKVAAAIAAMNR